MTLNVLSDMIAEQSNIPDLPFSGQNAYFAVASNNKSKIIFLASTVDDKTILLHIYDFKAPLKWEMLCELESNNLKDF